MSFISLEHMRDIAIIVGAVLASLAFLAIFVFTVVLGLTGRTLLSTIRTTIDDDVKPLVKSAQGTVKRLQGTSAFIGETAVSPIIRVYGIAAGTRRALGVLAGMRRRRRDAAAANNPETKE